MKKKGQKFLSLLLSLTMIIGMAIPLTVMSTARSPIKETTDGESDDTGVMPYIWGDADGNDKVAAADAREMIKASLGIVEFNDYQNDVCDLDSDGKISLIEARSVLRYAAKLIPDISDSCFDTAQTEEGAGAPQILLEGKYDVSDCILTVSVLADNAKDHLTLGGYLEYPEGFECISAEACEGKFCAEAGTADGKAVFGAISVTSFESDTVNLAEFKFKADSEKASDTAEIKCALSVDSEEMSDVKIFAFDVSGIICRLPLNEELTGSEDETTADEETTETDGTYESADNILLGDSNADGKVTAADAREMIRFATHLENPTSYQMKVCDLDSDGEISLIEARSVMRFAAKLTKFVVDSLDDTPEGDAAVPEFIIITTYDEDEDIISMKVVAFFLENHLTVKGFLDIPEGLEYISSDNLASSAAIQTGISTDGVSAAFGGLSTLQFDEDTFELAEFKFKINHDTFIEPIQIGGAFIVDEDNSPLYYVEETTLEDITVSDEDTESNFLYSWLCYDEFEECATFNIQLCNFDNVSDFPSGKITLNYPTDILKYTGFTQGDTDGVDANVTETSDGVLVVDYTASEDVSATDNMLVDLKFDVISESGFGYAEIKSVSPTYMTDTDGNRIDFSIGESEFICAHKYMEALEDKEPTCAMHGTRGGSRCKMCGYTVDTEYVAPLGHTRAEGGKCTVCGKYNEPSVIFDAEYIPESGIVDVDIKLDNAEDACAYDLYIEYPSDKLIPVDNSYYLDGADWYLENGNISCFADEIDGKGYITINVETDDDSWLSEQVNDIYYNFKFYCTDKNADSLTFTVDSSDYEMQSRVFPARDMINFVPDCTFTVETSASHSEPVSKSDSETASESSSETKTLGLTPESGMALDNENKTVKLMPSSLSGMNISEFKAQFTDKIESELDDSALVYNGMKFKYSGNEYVVTVKGDVTADGKISAADARTILRISAKLDTPDEITNAAADINSDGKVSASEARDALRFSAKLSSVLYLDNRIKKTG